MQNEEKNDNRNIKKLEIAICECLYEGEQSWRASKREKAAAPENVCVCVCAIYKTELINS